MIALHANACACHCVYVYVCVCGRVRERERAGNNFVLQFTVNLLSIITMASCMLTILLR